MSNARKTMNANASETNPERREFLRTSARWAVAGLVVGGTLWGMAREGRADCLRRMPCGGCPVFDGGCDLPKAAAWRRTGVGSDGKSEVTP